MASRKESQGIPLDVWEVALRRHALRRRKDSHAKPLSDVNLTAVVRTAFRLAKKDLAEDELEDWVSDIFIPEVLADTALATIGVGWPESQHGDAAWITVSAFPGGTVMATRRDSWGGREDLVFYFTIPPSLAELLTAATKAVFDDASLDGGDYALYDEDDGRPEDSDATPAEIFGFKELRAKWSRRLRALSRMKQAKGGRPGPKKSMRKH